MTILLKGKPLDHWVEGAGAAFDAEPEGEWKTWARERIEHLDGLPDAVFAAIPRRVVEQTVDLGQAFGGLENYKLWLAPHIPDEVPVLDMAGLVFPCLHYDGHTLPCLAVRNPYDIGFEPDPRAGDALRTVSPPFDRRGSINDSRGNYPHSFWSARFLRPYYRDKMGAPHIRIGWWSEGRAWYLSEMRHGGAARMLTQDFPAVFLPDNRPGHLRFQIVNYAVTDRKVEDGGWSDPIAVTHLHLNEKVHDAFVAGSPVEPDVPIQVAGTDRYEHLDENSAPVEFDSDWTPPPLPAAGPSPAVSDEGKAWLRARAKRYGKSRSTGKFWRELAAAIG